MQNFNDLDLSEPLKRAITELGYETPSPIQAQALPLLLGKDTDFLGLAATGTGKTAAFGIPLLERIDTNKKGVQALILCPTRELAMQVAGQINLLGKFKGIRALPVYGGTGYGDQIYGLKNGATVVVGTPGRVVDHIEKGTLRLNALETLILDEADEMISMGFKEDLEKVLSASGDNANIWLFSATMGPEVRRVADKYLDKPEFVQINRTEVLPTNVEQLYFMVHEYDKPEALCRIIDQADDFYGIVFCQTKALVSDLTQYLVERSFRVDCLHGDMDQKGRDRVMNAFRERKFPILIATDVACRGLDVKEISHVVNYSLPRELDNYVHRIGRTARSGRSGIAMSLVTNSHRQLIRKIEMMTKSKMKEAQLPSNKDVAFKKASKALAIFQKDKPESIMQSLLDDQWKAALEAMTKEEIAARFLALQFPELLAKKADPKPKASTMANTPNASDRDRGDRNDRRPPHRASGGDRGSYRGSGDRDRAPSRDRAPNRDRAPRREYAPSRDRAPSRDARTAPPSRERAPERRYAGGAPRSVDRAPRTDKAERPAAPRAEHPAHREFAGTEKKSKLKVWGAKPGAHRADHKKFDHAPRAPRQ